METEDVIVVDDSEEGGLDADPGLAHVTVVRTPGRSGFARAANAGLDAGEALGWDWALLLNDDAELLSGCFDALCARTGAAVGAVGPVVETETTAVESAGVGMAWWGRVRLLTAVPESPMRVDGLTGACLLVRASDRFDVGFAHGMEDLELCQRIRRRGQEVWLEPRARCRHTGGATLPRFSAEAQRHQVSGHLRLVGGGPRVAMVLALAVAQVAREGFEPARAVAIWEGWRDWAGR